MIENQAVPRSKNFLPELQSVRGLAALVVVLHHCSFYLDYAASSKKVAEILLNAHAAVVLFFVLSGYVLSASLLSKPITARQVFEFYLRRVFRIYPALWAGVALALVYVVMFHGQRLPQSVTQWWWPQSQREFPSSITGYILPLAGISTQWAIPLWTLKIELIASAVLPFAVIVQLRQPLLFSLTVLGSAFALFFLPFEISRTASYAPAFGLGVCAAYFSKTLREKFPADLFWLTFFVIGALTLLFGRNAFLADFRNNYGSVQAVAAESIGGAMLILSIAANQKYFAVLRTRLAAFLGDISYSLYLIHLPILGIVAGFWGETINASFFHSNRGAASFFLTIATLAFSLPLATLIHTYVELPGIELGRKFQNALHRRGIG